MNVKLDPGSFRDPDGCIFRIENKDRIYRGLRGSIAVFWKEFIKTETYTRINNEGMLVETNEYADSQIQHDFDLVLEHKPIAYISYYYEWPFNMLQSAALLHLELLVELLKDGYILKDATPFNVQFNGIKPIFIDIPSIINYVEGEPWIGYGQFCDTMLYPLLVEAYRGIPFQNWVRSSIEGLPSEYISRLFGILDCFKPGVLMHVKLRAALQKKWQNTNIQLRKNIKEVSLPRTAVLRNIIKLHKIVSALKSKLAISQWNGYYMDNSYEEADSLLKKDFVRESTRSISPGLLWDLGANTGTYSLVAAPNCSTVVSMEADCATASHLYEEVKKSNIKNILPLIIDLTNPSPDQGFAGKERLSIRSRGKPDMILALALVHHLAIASNIPLPAQIEWFSQLTDNLLIEFVDREDAMVKKLLINKDIDYPQYNQKTFENLLQKYYRIEKTKELKMKTRKLYLCSRN